MTDPAKTDMSDVRERLKAWVRDNEELLDLAVAVGSIAVAIVVLLGRPGD